MAIDERKVLAEDGTVFAAVDVSRSLVPGAAISLEEVRPLGGGRWWSDEGGSQGVLPGGDNVHPLYVCEHQFIV